MTLIFEEESHITYDPAFDGETIEIRGYLKVGRSYTGPLIQHEGDVCQLFRSQIQITQRERQAAGATRSTQLKAKYIQDMLRDMGKACIFGGYTTQGVKCIEIHERGKKVTLTPSHLMGIST